ncbi:M23 family metallopeptidase [Ornithinimicrobium sp. Arc0846-15]|nr:M23 family metallopeptidase [Ornithinimicrobium laminariae]
MRRTIAKRQTYWARLFLLTIVANLIFPIPIPLDLLLMAAPLALMLVPPMTTQRAPSEVGAPVRGRWVVLNSPGSAVPSHGTKAYGQMYAVDLLHPSDEQAPSVGWGVRGRLPESYSSFGEPIRAMKSGTIVSVQDSQRDHRGRNTWPLLIYMLTLEGFLRVLIGTSRVLGNHAVIEHDDGTFAAYAHLQQASATVRAGQRVHQGQHLARVGNTGNTSEPHLHVQLMDRALPAAAAGIPMLWPRTVIDPTHSDPRWTTGRPKATAQPAFPANGQIFRTTED